MNEDTLIIDTSENSSAPTSIVAHDDAKPYSIPISATGNALYDLVSDKDPILKEVIPEFLFDNPPEDPEKFAINLIGTMIRNRGLGLAAPQCGFRYNVFALNSDPNFMVCFNPTIIDTTSEEISLKEGCLSFPLLNLVVRRPSIIKVRFQDFRGDTHTEKFIGMTSRIFQHEIDHLKGITFDTKVSKIQLDSARKKVVFFKRKIKSFDKKQKQLTSLANKHLKKSGNSDTIQVKTEFV